MTASCRRWTFVIGKDGKILYKNNKVNAAMTARRFAVEKQ